MDCFSKKYGGKGYTKAQLSEMYQQEMNGKVIKRKLSSHCVGKPQEGCLTMKSDGCRWFKSTTTKTTPKHKSYKRNAHCHLIQARKGNDNLRVQPPLPLPLPNMNNAISLPIMPVKKKFNERCCPRPIETSGFDRVRCGKELGLFKQDKWTDADWDAECLQNHVLG